jgi:hypothetical protein
MAAITRPPASRASDRPLAAGSCRQGPMALRTPLGPIHVELHHPDRPALVQPDMVDLVSGLAAAHARPEPYGRAFPEPLPWPDEPMVADGLPHAELHDPQSVRAPWLRWLRRLRGSGGSGWGVESSIDGVPTPARTSVWGGAGTGAARRGRRHRHRGWTHLAPAGGDGRRSRPRVPRRPSRPARSTSASTRTAGSLPLESSRAFPGRPGRRRAPRSHVAALSPPAMRRSLAYACSRCSSFKPR